MTVKKNFCECPIVSFDLLHIITLFLYMYIRLYYTFSSPSSIHIYIFYASFELPDPTKRKVLSSHISVKLRGDVSSSDAGGTLASFLFSFIIFLSSDCQLWRPKSFHHPQAHFVFFLSDGAARAENNNKSELDPAKAGTAHDGKREGAKRGGFDGLHLSWSMRIQGM